MAKKYYAVKAGKKPGIYESWAACKSMVDGYKGAIYKGFMTYEEAKAFLGGGTIESGQSKSRDRKNRRRTDG